MAEVAVVLSDPGGLPRIGYNRVSQGGHLVEVLGSMNEMAAACPAAMRSW